MDAARSSNGLQAGPRETPSPTQQPASPRKAGLNIKLVVLNSCFSMAKEGTKQDRAQENVYLLSDLARLTAKTKLIIGRKRAPYKATNSVFIVLMSESYSV